MRKLMFNPKTECKALPWWDSGQFFNFLNTFDLRIEGFFFFSSLSSANSMMLLRTKMSMNAGVKFTKSFLPKPSEVRFLSLLYPRQASFNGSL